MVEIEEVAAASEGVGGTPTVTSAGNEIDVDGWEKLMGDDLIMKVSNREKKSVCDE